MFVTHETKTKKKKKSKISKHIWAKPCLKTRSDISACANIFLELPLTNSSIILEWIQHQTADHALTFICWLLIHFILLTLNIMMQLLEQNSEAAAAGVLKFLADFTGKHLCWSLFLRKLQVFSPAAVLKRDS